MALHFGIQNNQSATYFLVSYSFLAVSIFFLEKHYPFEKQWQIDDGQTFPDIAHTILTKGMVQIALISLNSIGFLDWVREHSLKIWNPEWNLFFQVVLGLVILEFGLYWAHRLSHEHILLWRSHVIHHSVERLWFVNTGRFHFLNTLFSVVMSLPLMFIIGVPANILIYCSGITAYFGILTHCNIDMKFTFLNYLFNTPGLHRWHHSMEILENDFHEGHNNYGENLVLWDQIFGTYYNPDRRPPVDIGVDEYVPRTFWQQLISPFRKSIPLEKGKKNFR